MVFGSIAFVFQFLPIFMMGMYILPSKLRNAWLLMGSMIFYAIGSAQNPLHIGMLAGSVVANYVFGRVLDRTRHKAWLMIAIGANLIYLGMCKYVFQVLPVGSSFYTFHAISYLCDIYRRTCHAENSFVAFGAYLCMFPKLTAGPIVTYPAIRDQMHNRQYTFNSFVQGLQMFVLGLGSKVLLANQVGKLWSQLAVIGYESVSTPLAWMGITAYAFQIYFDFLGYSYMAIGLGRMLGFTLPDNFNDPYLAVSMTEFWRRWHITLGSWFRDYVYIPLGGNRKGVWITLRNLLVVWLLTAIWHGASLNYILWGIFIFILISIEKSGLIKIFEKYRSIGHLYMIVVLPFFWSIFAITNMMDLRIFIRRLLGIGYGESFIFYGDYIKYGKEYGLIMMIGLLFIIRIPQKIWVKLKETYIGQIVLVAIFAISVYYLYIGMDSPFLYYQF